MSFPLNEIVALRIHDKLRDSGAETRAHAALKTFLAAPTEENKVAGEAALDDVRIQNPNGYTMLRERAGYYPRDDSWYLAL